MLFSSNDAANPAKFYMVSAPAHKACKTTFIPIEKAAKKPLGAMETSNKRVSSVHPSGCLRPQLSMGMTVLEPGVWNYAGDTHETWKLICILKFREQRGIPHDGRRNETRHIVMQNEQAVISPST